MVFKLVNCMGSLLFFVVVVVLFVFVFCFLRIPFETNVVCFNRMNETSACDSTNLASPSSDRRVDWALNTKCVRMRTLAQCGSVVLKRKRN